MRFRNLCLMALIASIAIYLPATPLYAQQSPPPLQAGNETRPSASAAPTSALKTLAAELAKRYNVEIVVDPGISCPIGLKAPAKDLSLFAALNALTHPLKNVALRRIYVPQDTPLPAAEKLAASVRALDHLSLPGLVVENPASPRAMLFLNRKSDDAKEGSSAGSVESKPCYLLYDTAAPIDGLTPTERLADLQTQQSELMAGLPADRRPNPIQAGLEMLQSLAPDQRGAFMNKIGQSGLQTWQGTAPDVRDAMMQQFMQTVQQSRPIGQNPPAPNANASPNSRAGAAPASGDPAASNASNALKALLDTLSRRYKVRILLDPDLQPDTPSQRPADNLGLDQALDAVTRSLTGVAWRRVYLRQPSPSDQSAQTPSIRDLVDAIRTLDHLPQNDFSVEDLSSQRVFTIHPHVPVSTSFPAELSRRGFASNPVIILYSERAKLFSALPPDQRLSELQHRQAELLQNMNIEEIAKAIIGEIETFQSADANTRSERMRLPLVAAMMAVWMPRKAQENKTPLP